MGPAPGEEAEDSIDRICVILSHPVRRAVLELLRETETASIEAITAELVDREQIQSDGGDQLDETVQIEIALIHNHLPKMADTGVISYDRQARTVGSNATTDAACALLDRFPDEDG